MLGENVRDAWLKTQGIVTKVIASASDFLEKDVSLGMQRGDTTPEEVAKHGWNFVVGDEVSDELIENPRVATLGIVGYLW